MAGSASRTVDLRWDSICIRADHPISPPLCLKHLSRASPLSQSVSATNSCKISSNLEGDARNPPPRPVCPFVPAALQVQTVRFLDLCYFVS